MSGMPGPTYVLQGFLNGRVNCTIYHNFWDDVRLVLTGLTGCWVNTCHHTRYQTHIYTRVRGAQGGQSEAERGREWPIRGQAELTTLGTLNTWHLCAHAERDHGNLSFHGINHLLFCWIHPFFSHIHIHFELTLHNKESVAARGDPWACGDRSEGGCPPPPPASSLLLQSLGDAVTVTSLGTRCTSRLHSLYVLLLSAAGMQWLGDWSNRGLRYFYDVSWCWIIRSLAAAELLFQGVLAPTLVHN